MTTSENGAAEARTDLTEIVASRLEGDTYNCTRVWDAWSYGTMSADDFTPASEDAELMADVADAILAAGYRKPRTIKTAAELEALPFGSAVQTSDDSDTAVLKGEGVVFRNQSGYEVSATDLWRFGTRPFTVIFEPTA